MVKEIRWSIRADQDRIDILAYWAIRNKSTTYSIKLNSLFIQKIKSIATMPDMGLLTKKTSVRIKVIKEYLIYYEINPDSIVILTIWDSRRNPIKFKL